MSLVRDEGVDVRLLWIFGVVIRVCELLLPPAVVYFWSNISTFLIFSVDYSIFLTMSLINLARCIYPCAPLVVDATMGGESVQFVLFCEVGRVINSCVAGYVQLLTDFFFFGGRGGGDGNEESQVNSPIPQWCTACP